MAYVTAKQIRLRDFDFETAECEYCKYFDEDYCKVLDQDVEKTQVCDAYVGDDKKFKEEAFKLKKSDYEAFTKGLIRIQPYKHFVTKFIDTPIGSLLLIKDSMRPKPHYFSLDFDFSNTHLAREHHWTQKEVDILVKLGK